MRIPIFTVMVYDTQLQGMCHLIIHRQEVAVIDQIQVFHATFVSIYPTLEAFPTPFSVPRVEVLKIAHSQIFHHRNRSLYPKEANMGTDRSWEITVTRKVATSQ